ncbi:hypothetical protein ACLX1H_005454 [Fusarium chlamydosporum]
MEAIFESEILHDAVYWDPVRGTKVCYEKLVEDEGYTYPCLLDGSTDSDPNSDSDDELPRYFRARSPLSEGSYNDAEMSTEPGETDFAPSNVFWIKYLKARTLGKVKTRFPTRDHFLLKAIAKQSMKYKSQSGLSSITTLEEEVQTVCEIVVRYGYIHDRRDFFLGQDRAEDDMPASCLDETCAVVRDGLLAVAIYLNEPEIFMQILSKEQAVTCPHKCRDEQGVDESQAEEPEILAPYTPWIPHVSPLTTNKKSSFQRPDCGRSLIRLANPTTLVVCRENMRCASILLDSISGSPQERDIVRQEIIAVSKTPKREHWLRFAIESGPILTKYNITLPGLQHELNWFGRTYYSGRKQAAIEPSKILDTTTSVQMFDIAYEAILAGYTEEEGVWWTKTTYREFYAAHTLLSWGTARIHRAVLDDCMPLVRRLVELGYHLGANHSAEDLKDEKVKALFDSEISRDISLRLAAERGDLEMVKLLLEIGAERSRKNVRKALWIAMEQNNRELLEVLMDKGSPEGLLNLRTKRCWRQVLELRGNKDLMLWVDIM